MITQLQYLKNFGAYNNYNRPAGLANFAIKNIIYGWNYSGKTTLSRLFQVLEAGLINPDFSEVDFSFTTADGNVINKSNFQHSGLNVRVFNSDFVEKNLSWNGLDFEPILLLGEDSIQAEKEIEEFERKVDRCRKGYAKNKKSLSDLEKNIADKKTSLAKQIKTILSLVESFTATNVNSILVKQNQNPKIEYRISASEHEALLNIATTANHNRLLPIIFLLPKTLSLDFWSAYNELITKTPQLSNVIDMLVKNPEISKWVESGLHLHENLNKCNFCENTIHPERMQKLREHFSKDLVDYRKKLMSLSVDIEKLYLNDSIIKNNFYPDFRDRAGELTSNYENIKNIFNSYLDSINKSIKDKINSPFESTSVIQYDEEIVYKVNDLYKSINDLIAKNNIVANNFESEKKSAIDKLKNHYVAKFSSEENLEKVDKKSIRYERNFNFFYTLGNNYKASISELKSTINLASMGKDEVNKNISHLLGANNLQIKVVAKDNIDRFQLFRGENIAKYLSDGEKTAIALSFYIAKLKEIKDFSKVVCYIDDPISSLDSNHIFQVNAIIREVFFKQKTETEWEFLAGQLFLSTHNFEFFNLLRQLPLAKQTEFYHTKRLTESNSTFIALPKSITKYSSEYHYLYNVIKKFYISEDKTDIEVLLAIPNALRRFLELYTYLKIPSFDNSSVDIRTETLFGTMKAKRILKVLHHFSHLNNIDRLAQNSDLLCDIEEVVNELMEILKTDTLHYEALEKSTID